MTIRSPARQTKIVATLGPASATLERVRGLVAAGVDVFRTSFSYTGADQAAEWLRIVREAEREAERPIGTIADLRGLKFRIGAFADGGIDIAAGHRIRLDLDPAPGDENRVSLPHPDIIECFMPGQDVVLDDGLVRLRVVDRGPDFAIAEVVMGKRLTDRKGVHLPGVTLPVSALTEADRADMRVALDAGFDWIALSYVRRPQDVAEARRLIGARAGVIAKIECESAVTHLDEIIALADGVTIARGDLGVEVPAERVPGLQKRIVAKARAMMRPVTITAQMLESMVHEAAPTRAEASDVATAVYDGADALVLSAETAVGEHALEAVMTMDRIARAVEEDPLYRTLMEAAHAATQPDSLADAVVVSAHQTARAIGSSLIVTYTTAGKGSLRAARERPTMPILALTVNEAAARRLTLTYGVRPLHVAELHSTQDVARRASELAVARDLAQNGDTMVITAGLPLGAAGTTNMMRVAWVDDGASVG